MTKFKSYVEDEFGVVNCHKHKNRADAEARALSWNTRGYVSWIKDLKTNKSIYDWREQICK